MFSVFFNSFKLWLVFVCQGSFSLRFLVCGSLATARRPSGSFVKCLHINDADELKARAVLRSFGCIHTNVCIVACKYSWLVRKMSLRGLSILFAHATLHQRDAVASAESSWYANLVVELFLRSARVIIIIRPWAFLQWRPSLCRPVARDTKEMIRFSLPISYIRIVAT